MKKILLVLLILSVFCVPSLAEGTYGHYFAPKWMPPITKETKCGWAFDLEYGHLFTSGFFWGIEVGVGISKTKLVRDGWGYEDYPAPKMTLGAVFNLGRVVELPYQFDLAYGGSIGPWMTMSPDGYEYDYYWGEYENVTSFKIGFGGPFIRLRWNYVEIMYRGLMGIGGSSDSNGLGFGYISQLMLGFNFAFDMRRQ